MPSIKDAKIKKYETFRFITYNFENLNIEISKNSLIEFLKKLYFNLTGIKISNKTHEIEQIKGNEIQYVLFYGNFKERKGFEYIYNSKDSTPETTSSFYMFEQTIAPDFHIYFNLEDKKYPLNKNSESHKITEIVVYMAQFFDKNEEYYENLFNNALKEMENFIKSN